MVGHPRPNYGFDGCYMAFKAFLGILWYFLLILRVKKAKSCKFLKDLRDFLFNMQILSLRPPKTAKKDPRRIAGLSGHQTNLLRAFNTHIPVKNIRYSSHLDRKIKLKSDKGVQILH